MEPPPPPPPPHGTNPQSGPKSGGLPDGKYDIFVIPPSSAGSGFIYLPSLNTQRNSFLAGCVCTAASFLVYQTAVPVVKEWFFNTINGGGQGVFMLMVGVAVLSWAFGKTQGEGTQPASAGSRPSSGPNTSNTHSTGAGFGGPHSHTAPPPPRPATPEQESEFKRAPPPTQSESAPPPKTEPPPQTSPPPPKSSWQRPQPAKPAADGKSSWERAREETRKREEEKRRAEEIKRRREELEKDRLRQREKEARERLERELKEKKEREIRELDARKEQLEKACKEREDRERREKEQKELIERLERERKERDEREERERQAAREKEAKELAEKLKKEAEEAAKKKPPVPTAATERDDDAYSFRPYDRRKRSAKTNSAESVYSEDSYAPSATTAKTTPPPSVRGPYTTKDPDKIIIKAVYSFNNAFQRTPIAQLVSGSGNVTDGLILRITTEGLFIDDDVRSVPQREWDIKAWTMKLAESCEVKGVHVLRASIRDQEGKRYVFIIPQTEGWKVAVGLQRLRKGTQVRALGVAGLPLNEAKAIIENLGWG